MMNENKRKFYTSPAKLVEFFAIILLLLFVDILFIFDPTTFEGYWKNLFFIFQPLILVALIIQARDNCFNFIEFSKKGMFHKNATYDWDSIHITAFIKSKSGMQSNKNVVRVPYYFAFSDHYLSYEETLIAYKKGLCISINQKRLEYFLDKYKRKIHIHDWAKLKFLRQLTERIEQHNNHVEIDKGEDGE